MIVLDTDVLSAVIKRQNEPPVIAWLDEQQPDKLHITAITLFETLSGIEKLPDGRKRKTLETALEQALDELLNGRVLPFDAAAARVASGLYGTRRRAGMTVGTADTQIAGIVTSRGATLATGNTKHFSDLAVPVVNPWRA